jgi:hypothetical protein
MLATSTLHSTYKLHAQSTTLPTFTAGAIIQVHKERAVAGDQSACDEAPLSTLRFLMADEGEDAGEGEVDMGEDEGDVDLAE